MYKSWDVTILNDDNSILTTIHVNTIREMHEVLCRDYPNHAPTTFSLMNKWASRRSGPHLQIVYNKSPRLTPTEKSRRYYSKIKSMRTELIELRKKLVDIDI